MEFNLKKTPVGILSSVLDTVCEQPVDIDFTLPDYCPDIEKILRCKLIPKIYNRNLSGGQLRIDGTTVVSILYVDPDGGLKACEQTVPFNSSFPLSSNVEDAIIRTNVKCEYVNCRALSRRRLTVHGAFSLYAKVLFRSAVDLFSPDESDSLEFKTKKLSCSALTALCQEQFNSGDELRITNKPSVDYIIDSSVQPRITEFKVIPDKLMLSGELGVRILYMSAETDKPQQIDYILPFSRVIDCEGIDDNTTVLPEINVLSSDVRLKNDILSEDPVVDVDSRICVTVEGYTPSEVEVVLDAFSTQYVTELNMVRVNIPTGFNPVSDSVMQKESVSFDENSPAEILDLSCDYQLQSSVISGENITVGSKLNVCILALDRDNQPVYIERTLEFLNDIPLDDSYNTLSSIDACVSSLSYRIGDNNNVELRCELRFAGAVMNEENREIVSDVNCDEDNKIAPKDSSLILYFSEQNESLWDIAKRYNTRIAGIYEENNLLDDSLAGGSMLLIPTI